MAQGRKILYFLGAGASVAAGAGASVQGGGYLEIPTQKSFWSTFLRFSSKDNYRTIESFLFRYFKGYARVPTRKKPAKRRHDLDGIDVEEVFTFLSERIRSPSATPQMRSYAVQVWNALVEELPRVFKKFRANKDTRKTYKDFLESHICKNDVIISFNYDTVFEDSLRQRDAWGYEGLQDTRDRLKILKPHGSINWQDTGEGIEVGPTDGPCVVVAPTHLKFIGDYAREGESDEHLADASTIDAGGYLDQAPQLREVWAQMESHMREAKMFVFIGYSFPAADLYFSSILRSELAIRAGRRNPPSVAIVNPDAVAITQKIQQRFSIPHVMQFFDMDQFIRLGRDHLIREIRRQNGS